jgi:hypothetical protein
MADDRYGARGGYASNSPDGPEDRDRSGARDERGFFDRGGNALRSWFGFGDDDPEGSYGRGVQSWGQANEGGNWGSGYGAPDRGGRQDSRQGFSGGRSFGPQDQHYLSWRDRYIAELDRDYEEYCRECGQDFHSSFDSWRRNRRSAGQNMGGAGGASASTGSSGSETAETGTKR